MTLQRFHRAYDPALVSAEHLIGFLPPWLQPYTQRDVLLYLTAVRTSGGNGRGQCGAGLKSDCMCSTYPKDGRSHGQGQCWQAAKKALKPTVT